MIPNFYILLALVPFFASRRYVGFAAGVAITLGAGLTATAAVGQLTGVEFGKWLPQFSAIGAFFALIFSITIPTAVLASVRRLVLERRSRIEIGAHFSATIVLFFALVGLLAATTRYQFLLYWELMTLASTTMLLFWARSREALHSAVGYFIVMHVGYLFIFGAFMALGISGHLFGVGAMSVGVWLLFFVGFALKSALFPLHFWLPSTYRSAEPMTAAVMGGAVTNIGLYGIISVTYMVADLLTVAYILIFFGAATALLGASKMIGRTTIRRVLSYSSIDNIGIVVLAIGLGFYGKVHGSSMVALLALGGALLHILSHAMAKTLLFVSAGAVESAARTSTLSALGGVARRMPVTCGVFAVGGLSLCAIPPFGGFVGEFMILSATFGSIAWGDGAILGLGAMVVVALASASTIFNMNKVFGLGFLGGERSGVVQTLRENISEGGAVAYAILTSVILVGVWAMLWLITCRSVELFGIRDQGGSIIGSALWICGACVGVALLAVGLVRLKRWLIGDRQNMVIGTWSCASNRRSYARQSAESWVGEAHDTFTLPIGGRRREERRRFSRRATPAHLMRRWTARLALLQTGRTSHYVMHILLFLALVLLLTLTHAI